MGVGTNILGYSNNEVDNAVKKIIKHEYNGFLVSSQKEWIESLVKLLKSENLISKNK